MKRLALLLILALASTLNAAERQQAPAAVTICPLYELMDLGNGLSEYYCEICTGVFDVYVLPSNLPAGDCSTGQGCFTEPDAPSLPDYFERGTLSSKAKLMKKETVRVGDKMFRLFTVRAAKMQFVTMGYEIKPNPSTKATKVLGKIEKSANGYKYLKHQGSKFRLVTVGKRS